jgi:hypothetical protein
MSLITKPFPVAAGVPSYWQPRRKICAQICCNNP